MECNGRTLLGNQARWEGYWGRVRWFLPALVVAVLFRLRFFFTPLTADEGGFLAIGRWWGRGGHLYRDVFVDRPQGLLVLFRLLAAVGLDRPNGVRLIALLFCLLGAAACGRIAARLVGQPAAWITALVVAALISIPRLEGFIANGELLSGAVGALSLATVLRAVWERAEPSLAWVAAGGVLAGIAVSLKQSGFDAVGAAVVAVVFMLLRGSWSGRQKRLAPAVFLLGAAVPVALMVLHAAVTGWHDWWYEVVKYRSLRRSIFKNAAWKGLRVTGRIAGPILLLTVLVALYGVARFGRRLSRGTWWIVGSWCLIATFAFLSGGQFFRHYWIILMFPLGVSVGLLCSIAEPRVVRNGMLVLALLGPAVYAVRDVTVKRELIGPRLSSDSRLYLSEKIADWFEARANPGDQIYAMCAGGALYGNISVNPPFRHLWFSEIMNVPGAVEHLLAMLNGDKAPRFVVDFDTFERCDPSGNVAQAMAARYRKTTTFGDFAVWERNP